MDHFVDIHLLPDPELPAHVLMGALYTKLHRALVMGGEGDAGSIAISFPGYSARPGAINLGHTMRLLSSEPGLHALASMGWLGSLRDQVSVNGPAPVPITATHRNLRRVQAKSNPERLRRRLIKRHGIDDAEARKRIPDGAAEVLTLPFLQLHSASTGQNFRLFLRLGHAQATSESGVFNTYGLSTTATVPWF
jgi:CRISPR-associated endonuclease Csy4